MDKGGKIQNNQKIVKNRDPTISHFTDSRSSKVKQDLVCLFSLQGCVILKTYGSFSFYNYINKIIKDRQAFQKKRLHNFDKFTYICIHSMLRQI